MAVPRRTRSGRAPGRQASLTPERIVDGAVELGLGNFKMTELAEHLGVTSQALYRWVADREELLDLVADSVVRRITLPPLEPGEDWSDWLVRFARDLRRELLQVPGIAARGLTRTQVTAAFVRTHTRVVEVLRAAGMSEVEAVRAAEIFGVAVLGWVAREQSMSSAKGGRRIAAELAAARSGNAEPAAVQVIPVAPDAAEERFSRMVETILAGIEATAS